MQINYDQRLIIIIIIIIIIIMIIINLFHFGFDVVHTMQAVQND